MRLFIFCALALAAFSPLGAAQCPTPPNRDPGLECGGSTVGSCNNNGTCTCSTEYQGADCSSCHEGYQEIPEESWGSEGIVCSITTQVTKIDTSNSDSASPESNGGDDGEEKGRVFGIQWQLIAIIVGCVILLLGCCCCCYTLRPRKASKLEADETDTHTLAPSHDVLQQHVRSKSLMDPRDRGPVDPRDRVAEYVATAAPPGHHCGPY